MCLSKKYYIKLKYFLCFEHSERNGCNMDEQAKRNFRLMFSRVWIILVLAVAGALIAYFSYVRTFEEKYEAKIRLIIMTADVNNRALSVFDSIRSSQMAVGDVSQIITSEMVMAGVEKDCGIYWPSVLEALNINAIPNTRTMEISARYGTPEQALTIIQSLEKNLGEVLKDVDSNIIYKVLSRPYADTIAVNGYYPIIVMLVVTLGGIFLGCLLNLALGEKRSRRSKHSQARDYTNQPQGDADQSESDVSPSSVYTNKPLNYTKGKSKFTLPASDSPIHSEKY